MSTKVKKMLFILSKATIENAYAAFVMANGARMEGIESEIFFTFLNGDVFDGIVSRTYKKIGSNNTISSRCG